LSGTHTHDRRRFDIFDDLQPYFKNYSHTDTVYSPGPHANFVQVHALLLVGYDNVGRYWVAR
jgi:hypothetical protein